MRPAQEIEADLRRDESILQAALAAYNAVWQSWQGLDASTVEQCRRAAMAAALGATGRYGQQPPTDVK
jgi:hypothetical protein